MNTKNNESPFSDVIYSYTRTQAVAAGVQIEVSTVAAEAGFRFSVFLTRAVYDAYVTVPPNVTGQDEAGRTRDLAWMLRFAVRPLRSQRQPHRLTCEIGCHLRRTRPGQSPARNHHRAPVRSLTFSKVSRGEIEFEPKRIVVSQEGDSIDLEKQPFPNEDDLLNELLARIKKYAAIVYSQR